MIYDKLTNISRYLGINANLDIAVSYVLTHDLSSLSIGKTVLDGDMIYINVMEASASPEEQQKYEIHKNYMDIQIDLTGTEIIQIGDSSSMQPLDTYNPETDFGTVDCRRLTSCTMGKGNFIICMAGEPHKPGISSGQDTALLKCVFKVHV